MINKFSVEEACDIIFLLKLGKLTCGSIEYEKCISSDLVKFGFGTYQARPCFDNKGNIHSLFDTQVKITHVPSMEYFWRDCTDELEV